MLRYALVPKDPPADAQAQAEEAEHGKRAIETLDLPVRTGAGPFAGPW
ncbi:hypothetical protein [Acidovorax sp.]